MGTSQESEALAAFHSSSCAALLRAKVDALCPEFCGTTRLRSATEDVRLPGDLEINEAGSHDRGFSVLLPAEHRQFSPSTDRSAVSRPLAPPAAPGYPRSGGDLWV